MKKLLPLGAALTLALALTAPLASCGNLIDSLDQSEIPGYTKEWLRDQHGQQIAFRNAAGQVRTLSVWRKDQVFKGQSKTGSFEIEDIRVEYRNGPDSLLNLSLNANANSIYVTQLGKRCGSIHTFKQVGRTSFDSYEVPRLGNPIVAQDTLLGNRKFRYLGRLGVPVAAHPTDTLSAVYFSHADGLVAFISKRGGLWLRQ